MAMLHLHLVLAHKFSLRALGCVGFESEIQMCRTSIIVRLLKESGARKWFFLVRLLMVHADEAYSRFNSVKQRFACHYPKHNFVLKTHSIVAFNGLFYCGKLRGPIRPVHKPTFLLVSPHNFNLFLLQFFVSLLLFQCRNSSLLLFTHQRI